MLWMETLWMASRACAAKLIRFLWWPSQIALDKEAQAHRAVQQELLGTQREVLRVREEAKRVRARQTHAPSGDDLLADAC